MWRKIIVITLTILISYLLSCEPNQTPTSKNSPFLYKGASINNNDFIGAIIKMLPNHRDLNDFSLYPKENLIVVKYNEKSSQNAERIIITNSTYLFNLVEDIHKVTFHFNYDRYTIYKEDVDELYEDIDYQKITNEDKLKQIIKKKIEDSVSIENFFK
ncbi:hypothetical protein GLW08_20385 [Pontibacillus yanchengensis]|uniref:Uncharacterized protein n=2 Tax=Pontibacillus yanchengensis TaxID=462910 RepID=A0ACC7VJR0_9BACI|nr:hypothetical protein [Pontibacillus yanchengensis]MYL35463.1 hypothetical protein [Pontibacillus yanchengensis]MYL55663.1 hypothetical protein [Pontibacillus yanchengensis]